jgi:hypothetical protein
VVPVGDFFTAADKEQTFLLQEGKQFQEGKVGVKDMLELWNAFKEKAQSILAEKLATLSGARPQNPLDVQSTRRPPDPRQ